jgi:hypothetical protein
MQMLLKSHSVLGCEPDYPKIKTEILVIFKQWEKVAVSYLNIYDTLNLAHFTRLHVVGYDGNKYFICQINKIYKFTAWNQQIDYQNLYSRSGQCEFI